MALVIGGVVSAFALGAARVSGIDSNSSGPTAEPSLVIPSDTPTPDATPSSSAPASPTARPTRKPTPISLQASPQQVTAGGRIDLTGSYAQGTGATLQVQRFDGGWTDFPVTVSVNGTQFATYIQTSRTGDARFRVLDKASGKASNEVRVTVG